MPSLQHSFLKALLLLLLLLVAPLLPGNPARADEVTVFAASSTADAVTEIGARFAALGLGTVRSSFAASSTLARQIEQGAPADVFVSADQAWMDYLAERGLIVTTTRVDLLSNRLVLVAPAGPPGRPAAAFPTDMIGPDFALAGLLGDGRLAVGDPDHVPVGRYARRALESLGLWAEVAGRLARASSVRAALTLVARGESPLGIVFATDAVAAESGVRVVGTFPATASEPILYPAALVGVPPTEATRSFFRFLTGPEARAIFARHGFGDPPGTGGP